MRALKRLERFSILRRRLVEHSEHQCGHAICDRHFDLWDARTQTETAQQYRQWLDQLRNRLGQDRTCPEIRNERGASLAKTDDGLLLLRDPPRAEPGTTPIVPSGALQRRQDRARRDLTDTRERLEQSALLERDLLLG